MGDEKLEYWNYNIPLEARTAECPQALRNLSDKDKGLLSLWEDEYHTQTWDEVKKIVAHNRVDLFHRGPTDLRKYRQFTHYLSQKPGGIQAFIINDRLKWSSTMIPRGAAFESTDDLKILYNDWPYGVDPRIVHLVVWTKFDLPEDPATGDLTLQIRKQIDDFVNTTFVGVVEEENVVWFRNWKSLKSVESVEHFHVMLLSPDPEFVKEITQGDKPYCSEWTPE